MENIYNIFSGPLELFWVMQLRASAKRNHAGDWPALPVAQVMRPAAVNAMQAVVSQLIIEGH